MGNYTKDNSSAEDKYVELTDLLEIDYAKGLDALVKYTREGDSNYSYSAYKDSGIEYVSILVERYLKKYVKNILVEYSLLSSTLDPDNPGKLQCCSFVIGDDDFRKIVDEKYSACIAHTAQKNKGLSLYQHRHFLYDLKTDDTIGVECKNRTNEIDHIDDGTKTMALMNGQCLVITTKEGGYQKGNYFFETDPNKVNEDKAQYRLYKKSNDEDIYIEAFLLERSYEEMIAEARNFKESRGNAVVDIQNCLHSFCHQNITNALNRNNTGNKSVYFSFPIFSSKSSNVPKQFKLDENKTVVQGIGACFVYFEPLNGIDFSDDNCVEELKKDICDFVRDVAAFVRFFSGNYVLNMGFKLQSQAQKETIKSAKAAIMSRNMSHNLGSHVMAYLKQQLGSVTSITNPENRVLSKLIPLSKTMDPAVKAGIEKLLGDTELPFLVGLGRFIGYLQERQDYIATISTDYIPYGAPVNLKDAIYDELNPDLRYMRHKDDSKNRPTNILLSYIAKSEGLSRENMNDCFKSKKDIRFGFVDYSTGEARLFGIGTLGDEKPFLSENPALSQMRKINFSLPGGLVGRQAIFSIFENLIRNAAKHGDTSGVENLDLTLDVIDGSMIKNKKVKKWNVRVCDKEWRSLYEKSADLDDIYLLTITDNLPCKDETIKHIQKGLYEDFVDKATGQMTTANKGIKEVRISAAWIRSETDEDCYLKYGKDTSINNLQKKAPLVAVEKTDDGHLRYVICIRKNKTVAIVSEVNIKEKDENGKDTVRTIPFNPDALKLFNSLQLNDTDRWSILTEEELINSKSSYSFILCSDNDEVFEKLRPHTSNRLCRWKVNNESLAALATMDKDDATLMYIYRLYTGLDKNSDDICINDPKAFTENNERERRERRLHFNKIKIDNRGDYLDCKYLYKTHYSTKKEYVAFYKDFINKGYQYDCIEGITGDNSSDRMIRREWLDERWYYTHLYSLRKKVAIIDERIFKMVHDIDEKVFEGDDFEEIKNKVSYEVEDGLFDEVMGAQTIEDLEKLAPEILKSIISVMGKSHLTPYYRGKSVDVYTVVKGPEGKMVLIGCTNIEFHEKEFKEDEDKFCNSFEVLATFESDGNGGFALRPESDEYSRIFANRYDYISIHQGILDKIYENLGVKNNDEGKCKLTASIHQCMMADKSTYGSYLPRFIIHSGRAKPTKNDMPQEQPFIQYAAIENAVKDCKPMLVELLDFAKYESFK